MGRKIGSHGLLQIPEKILNKKHGAFTDRVFYLSLAQKGWCLMDTTYVIKKLSNKEVEALIDLEVTSEVFISEVRRRFGDYYSRAAFSWYENEYKLIGNLTEF